MKKEDLNKLSREELDELFTNFYNDVDKVFLDNRSADSPFVVSDLFAGYIMSSKKVLTTIKDKNGG